jgi:hypothetical protein
MRILRRIKGIQAGCFGVFGCLEIFRVVEIVESFERIHEFRKFVRVLRQGEQPQWQLSVEPVIEEHVKVAGAVWVGLQASKRSCCSGG